MKPKIAADSRSGSIHGLPVIGLVMAAVIFLLIAIADLSSVQASTALPTLGDAAELSSNAEKRIGDQIAASIYRDPDYVDDPVLGDYIQSIWQPLLSAARARGEINAELDERFAWQILLMSNRTINASAWPGGYMMVHLGLLAVVSNPSELASVLAHELSHVTQRHISRLISKQGQQTPWLVAAMVLGTLAAGKNPEMANAAIATGQALTMQNQLNFSRDMEREADRVGLGVLMDAGFDGVGFMTMFDKMARATRLNDDGSYPYLRTHPLTTERIANVQARLQLKVTAQTSAQAQEDTLYALMAARARTLLSPNAEALRDLVTQAESIRVGTSAARTAGAWYAGALAAAKLGHFPQAQRLADKLHQQLGSQAPVIHTLNLLDLELDVLAHAKPRLQWLTNQPSPQARADVLLSAQALIQTQRANQAAQNLQTWVSTHPKDASAWQWLAQAYGRQGQTLRAITADAEAHVALMDYSGALNRLRAAQDFVRNDKAAQASVNNHIDASIIDVRAHEVERLAKEQALQDKLE